MDRRRVLTAGVAAAALVLVVLAVNLLGAWRFTNRFDLPIHFGPQSGSIPVASYSQPSFGPRDRLGGSHANLAWLGVALRVLVVAVAVAAVVYLIGLLQARRRRGLADLSLTESPPGAHRVVLDAVQTAREYLLRRADLGDVAQTVVEAWVALEQVSAQAGRPRRSEETPTEFTAAVLRSVSGADTAITELLGLYQRARYGSDRVVAALGPADAQRAADLLGEIADRIDTPTEPTAKTVVPRTAGRHE